MSRKPISMRKIKEVLRLKFDGSFSNRAIEQMCKVGRTTVQDYHDRAKFAGLTSWEQIKDISEDELEKQLFPVDSSLTKPQFWPDWKELYIERKKPWRYSSASLGRV